jgi:very-short-patch-repair endonuclease
MAAVDAVIAAIAGTQHGLVTWGQMIDAGISPAAVRTRVGRGQLHRVHRGVYLVGHEVMPLHARELAAVLATGEGAALSHRSAAEKFVLLPATAGDVDVSVAGRNPGREPGIRIHRPRYLDPRDVTTLHGIPITTVPRTLLDVAEQVDSRLLERAFDEAMTRRLTTPKQLRALLDRSPGRRGAGALYRLLDRTTGSKLSRSNLEELMLALIRAARLPDPEMNVLLLGKYKVDFLWREFKLVVETDGARYHAGVKRRTADTQRDSELRSAGWKVERITDYELEHEPQVAIARITRALYAAA